MESPDIAPINPEWREEQENVEQSIRDASSYLLLDNTTTTTSASVDEESEPNFFFLDYAGDEEEEGLQEVPLLPDPVNAEDAQFLAEHDVAATPEAQTCCLSPETRRFLAIHGAFFLGTLFATAGAFLDVQSAWIHRHDPADVEYDDEWFEDEWVYNTLPLLGWDYIKFLNVMATFMYLLNVSMEVYYKEQESCFDWLVVGFFGSAATLDLLSSLCMDDYEWKSFVFGNLSTDMFLLSAIFEVAANRAYYRNVCRGNAYALTLLIGNLLFLSGALVDAVTARLDGPSDTNSHWLWFSTWGLVSALCWLLNSVLGVIAERLDDKECYESVASSIDADSSIGSILDDEDNDDEEEAMELFSCEPADDPQER